MNNDFDIETGVDIEEDSFDGTGILSDDMFEGSENNGGNDGGTYRNIRNHLIIAIIIAAILIIAAVLIWKFAKAKTSNNKDSSVYTADMAEDTREENTKKESINNDEYSTVEVGRGQWTYITEDEDVSYNEDKIEAIFTVTDIKHKARLNGNEIEIRSEIAGSISGFTGTYSIDVDYDKGSKLNIGDTIGVYVTTGTYGNDTVVGVIDVK